jgi:hypothetical protein
MKTYKQISDDIKSMLVADISGTQLDLLVGILSTYAYNVQSNAVSQLLENNLDTAININSIIAKAMELGVSVPRVTNVEVEFQAKSTAASYILHLGDEVLSISKYKFLFLGYYNNLNEYIENQCNLSSSDPILIRCLVTDGVTEITSTQTFGVIYPNSVTNVSDKIFVYKDDTSMNVYNSYGEYLRDSGENKVVSITGPDYCIKVIDYNDGDSSEYRVILPNGMNSISELVPLIKNKAVSRNVTVSKYRDGSDTELNIKITKFGADVLDKDSLVRYVELNLKLTQLIKSNTDIIAFFENYLFTLYGVRYTVSYHLGSDFNIYVNDINFPLINVNNLIDLFYVNVENIYINPGVRLTANISIRLNNIVDQEVSDLITSYVNEYQGKFNTLIDEFDLITKINSINPLINLTQFEVRYSALIRYNGNWVEIQLSSNELEYQADVPGLFFGNQGGTIIIPIPGVVYKLYTAYDKFLNVNLIWL